MTEQAFWLPEGEDLFRATIHTQGPWNPDFQHGGPPGGLLVRQLERCAPREDMLLARVSIDILGPIPITALRASARVTRPGRSVELVEASLEHEGRTLMRASGWRVRVPGTRPSVSPQEMPFPLPEQSTSPTTAPGWGGGFLQATEWRYVHGGYTHLGPATAWVRMRYPLIAGETASPLQRLILSADSANGISSPLDIRDWQFIPPELTVHCLRAPVGEWICLDASTTLQAEGTGLATADLYDERSLVGRSAQALFISRRA